MDLSRPVILDFPRILDERGNLSFFEQENHIPFQIERTYWIYDVPGGERRVGRALRNGNEVIVALTGSFDVMLHDGISPYKFHLSRSYYGLYIPLMTWRELDNFSTNSLALVVTDKAFSENEYIRDFDDFKRRING